MTKVCNVNLVGEVVRSVAHLGSTSTFHTGAVLSAALIGMLCNRLVHANDGPGETIAVLSGPTQYFTSTGNEPVVMDARHQEGTCLIGRRLGNDSNVHFKLVPDDGGAATWSMDTTGVHTGTGRPGGAYIYEDGSKAIVVVDGGDNPPHAVAGVPIAIRLDMSDGTHDWSTQPSATSGGYGTSHNSCLAVDGDEANDNVYFQHNASGDELKQFTASTGVEQAVSGDDTGIGSGVAAMCLTPDKDYLCVLGYAATPELVRYTVPMSGLANNWDDYSGNELQLDGTDTTNDFGYAQRLEYCAKLAPARDGRNTVYVCMGYGATTDNPHVGEYDPGSGSYGAVVTEVDVVADADFTPATYNWVIDIAVDSWGYVYCLVINGLGDGDDTDIVRYDPDLSNPFSFSADGGVSWPDRATYGRPVRLSVDESDTVFLGLADGYVATWSQS